MDKNRAKEIISSPSMINVTYKGTKIYIESVNENMDTAYIHPLNDPNSKQEVSIDSLQEQ